MVSYSTLSEHINELDSILLPPLAAYYDLHNSRHNLWKHVPQNFMNIWKTWPWMALLHAASLLNQYLSCASFLYYSVMPQTCTKLVISLNLGWATSYPDSFVVFLNLLSWMQDNHEIGHNCTLPNSYLVIMFLFSLILCNFCHWNTIIKWLESQWIKCTLVTSNSWPVLGFMLWPSLIRN